MSSKLHSGVLVVCCLGLTLPAAAQLDSSALRMKYGSPMNRETFRIPPGFDLVVDYGANNQVCRLEVPALMPTDEKVSNLVVMNQRMYEFLAGLVPLAMRGKEIRGMVSVMGIHSVKSTEYEHVTISEVQGAEPFASSNTITVAFKNASCQTPASQ
jgi:hypothetical protein